jgi:ribosomal RNA methyltransferase Nop2
MLSLCCSGFRDLAEYYGYIQELSEFLLDLFPPAECVQYMEASDRPRPLVIRTNTLKTNRKDLMETLRKRGVTVEDIDWSKVAIKVTESSVPIGATPEYLAGHYMLQSAASLNPVMALAPLPGEKVLDMSAAPGGKTSYIAQLMKNSGTLIANDLKMERQKATVANLHRLGVKNAVVCCYDGRKIGSNMKGFDRVLLDAPCSGLGVISRDQSVKIQRTVRDIQRISHLQKELLRAAVDAVDPHSPTGGIVVYSTCSVSTEENEQVVDFILRRRFVRLVETGLEVGKPGFTRHKERRFHPSLVLTRRFYPHVHNMDGFYVAKLKKYKNGIRGEEEDDEDLDLDNDIDKDTDDCELDNSYSNVTETEMQQAEGDTGVLDKKNSRVSYKGEYASLATQERKKTFVLEEKETKTVGQEKKSSSKGTAKSFKSSSVQEEKDAKTSTEENKKTLSSASEIKKTSDQEEIKLSAQEEKKALVQEEKKTSSLQIKKTSAQEEKKSSEKKKSVQVEKKSSSEIAKGEKKTSVQEEKKTSVQEEKKISVQEEKKISVQEEKKTSFKELKKQPTPVDSLTIRTGELTAGDQRGPVTGAPARLKILGEPRKRKRSIQDLRVQMRRTAQISRQED